MHPRTVAPRHLDPVRFAVTCGLSAAVALGLPARSAASDCTQTSVGLIPINDLGTGTYLGQVGGLYPGGVNVRPLTHETAGRDLARGLRPLDTNGQPAEDGRIVLMTVGMSNTHAESNAFIAALDDFANLNPAVTVFNGAEGGVDAIDMSDPDAPYWDNVMQRLTQAGLSRWQVQAIWLKQAISNPGVQFPDDEFPEDAQRLRSHLDQILHIVHDRFPNARLAYLSSRIYAGYATTNLNPEPYAYQAGFAVKFLLRDQISGDPTLNFSPDTGLPVEVPWLSWGPYLWADGLTPRSDGLIWECEDLSENDGTHPSPSGAAKVAGLLLDYFSADATTRTWFVAEPADLNDDGIVDLLDLSEILTAFASCIGEPRYEAAADIDLSGCVDLHDLSLLLSRFGVLN